MDSWAQVGGNVGIGLCLVLVLRTCLIIWLAGSWMYTKIDARRRHALVLLSMLLRIDPPHLGPPDRSSPAESDEAPDDTSDDA